MREIIIAILSAIVGAGIGVFGSYGLERRRQRYVAKIQIAINLRRWLNRTLYRMSDVITWVNSEGVGGSLHSTIPNFRFEKSLEPVALLEHGVALEIFALIYEKDNANSEVAGEIEYGDSDDAVDIWRNRCAEVWLVALGIFNRISTQIDSMERVFSDANKETMQNEIDRFQELKKKRDQINSAL